MNIIETEKDTKTLSSDLNRVFSEPTNTPLSIDRSQRLLLSLLWHANQGKPDPYGLVVKYIHETEPEPYTDLNNFWLLNKQWLVDTLGIRFWILPVNFEVVNFEFQSKIVYKHLRVTSKELYINDPETTELLKWATQEWEQKDNEIKAQKTIVVEKEILANKMKVQTIINTVYS